MASKVDVLRNSKDHLQRYPVLLNRCHESALIYANCVIRKVNLEKNNCQSAFNNFKVCLIKNVIERKANS
ncbi:uncharacterized protein LOC117171542 isoform X2 [Belonocnema kinseyi]|uniref:uncharacterized protein LOC117171542 isoform X2 n=1 Tax=Belonocnema kinseyi TaxID=2817044 RepID=UPI00143DDBF9|nr:uncharacterized protein LOC117171542 isoform X2 [Belonocnema kinseyi]